MTDTRRWPTRSNGRRLLGFASTLAVVTAACGDSPEAAPEAEAETTADVVVLTEAQLRAAGIRTAVPEPGTVRGTVEVPGSAHAPDTAQAVIGSIVEGRVVGVRVVPGDVVMEGETLVEIHAHELAEAQRDFTSAEAEVVYRRSAYSRSEELLEAGAVSLEEVQRRQADLGAAEAERRRAEEMIEHLAPTPDGNASAVATRDGTVFAVHARLGQAVLPGTPLVELGRTDVLWVTAFVPEETAGRLFVGDTVAVRFGDEGRMARAHLVRAANYVDPSNRSVEMRFELDLIPPGVRPGSFAVVSVSTEAAFDGLELQEDAAVRLGERDVVFVAEGPGSFRAFPVEVMPMGAGRIGVRGAPVGVEIVVEGAYFLKAQLELAAEAVAVEGAGGVAP